MAATKQLCVLPPDSQSVCCGAAAPSIPVPGPIFNSRGLTSIQYRIGTFTSFRRAMLDAIAQPDLMASVSTTLTADITAGDLSISVGDFTQFPSTAPYRIKIGNEYLTVTAGAGTSLWSVLRGVDESTAVGHANGDAVILDPPNPFAIWREGGHGDYQTMLVELWAYLADVLTFYQERIANEAYLPTATQRSSLLRLAELIDYDPGPGAGAAGLVAFTAQKDKTLTVPSRFRVGSKTSPGKTAAVFETSSAITALADHNAIPVTTVNYTNQFARITTGRRTIVLKGVNNALSVGDYVLVVANENRPGEAASAYRLSAAVVDRKANTTTITWPEIPGFVYDQTVVKVALYAFRVRAGAFGNNAPQWNALPPSLTTTGVGSPAGTPPYTDNWDSLSSPAAYVTSDGNNFIYLDALYDSVKATPQAPEWTLMVGDASGPLLVRIVTEAGPASHVGYTLNARVTRLKLAQGLPAQTFSLRTTIVLTGTQRLSLQNLLPATDPVSGSVVTLSGKHTQLRSGQAVVVQGKRFDPATSEATDEMVAESRILDGLPEFDSLSNTTTVQLTVALTKLYDPASTVLMANVVEVTQGETVKDEVLGSSSGVPFQSFALKKKPLTYLPSSDPEGLSAVQSTLLVTVNGVRWAERPNLLQSAASTHDFTTTVDEGGQTSVLFGDGYSGAIPPTGRDNIHARYRKGLGSSGNLSPGGIQQLIDALPGLQKATNPLPSGGGADAESNDQIRSNAPSSVSTFGRAVSTDDYAALALRFPSIVKAAAVWVRHDPTTNKPVAQPYIQLTVATADGTKIAGSVLIKNLRTFLDNHRDPNVPLRILDFTRVLVDLALTVDIRDGHPREATLASVRAALNPDPTPNPDGGFGFFSLGNLKFGQSIHLSAVYAVIQAIEGVSDVRITTLRRMDLDSSFPDKIRDDIFVRPAELAVIQNTRDGAPVSDGVLVVSAGIGGFIDT